MVDLDLDHQLDGLLVAAAVLVDKVVQVQVAVLDHYQHLMLEQVLGNLLEHQLVMSLKGWQTLAVAEVAVQQGLMEIITLQEDLEDLVL